MSLATDEAPARLAPDPFGGAAAVPAGTALKGAAAGNATVSATGQVAPAPVHRDTRLDLVRGWLQLQIFASHTQGSFAGAWLIHGAWGLSDSSEQFVFLSGLVLGSVFARKARRDGWPVAGRDMLLRAGRLWRTHLLTLAGFGAMLLAVNLALPGEAEAYGWGYFLRAPVQAAAAATALAYQPVFLDALPVFIWSMLVLPLFAWAAARTGAWALLPSALLWLGAQAGWLAGPDLSGDTPPAFDPFAWQALFMLGAWLGRRKLLSGGAIPPRPWMLPAAALVMAAGLAVRLSQHGLLPLPGTTFDAKVLLSPARLLHALSLAYVVARLVPADLPWMHGPLPRLLGTMGRHSLQVFCAGLFLSYGGALALRLHPGWTPLLDPVLILGGAGLLALYARRLDHAGPRHRRAS
jgi:hypothetical protein